LRAGEHVDFFLRVQNPPKAGFEVVRGLPRAELERLLLRSGAPLPPVLGVLELLGIDGEFERGSFGSRNAPLMDPFQKRALGRGTRLLALLVSAGLRLNFVVLLS
jgi:hypothetical protein